MSFALVTEEAIAKGIRRIVALTGPEALKVCLCAFVKVSLLLLLNYCPRLRVLFCIMYQTVMNVDAIRRCAVRMCYMYIQNPKRLSAYMCMGGLTSNPRVANTRTVDIASHTNPPLQLRKHHCV